MNPNPSRLFQSPSESAAQNQSSRSGRKRKWYMVEWFEEKADNNLERAQSPETANSTPRRTFHTSISCGWQTRAKTPNATQMRDHLLRCTALPRDVRTKLLRERTLLKRDQSRYGGHSELFRRPITPTKPKRTSSTANNSRSHAGTTNSLNCVSEVGESAVVALNFEEKVESQESYRVRMKLNELRTRFLINNMLPFAIFSRKPGKNLFYQIAKVLNPDLCDQIPSMFKMSERNLNIYYESMMDRVKSSISSSFANSYGTLLFDGWTDDNNESVVNVMLSVTGVERTRKTFFLSSTYTGSEPVDANYYADLLENTVLTFGTMKNICAVVSDGASCCRKAKQKLIEKHNHLLPVQDQTHSANLLMQDLGSISWISTVLSKVSSLVTEVRAHSKLYHRYKELKDLHNLQLFSDSTPPATTRNTLDEFGRLALPRTAVLPSKPAKKLFASAEGMLRSVLRSLTVFQRVIECSDFATNLFGARDARTRQRRSAFEATIRDQNLFQQTLDLYHILRLVRQYLHLFDEESSLISEVYPATKELRHRLSMVPLTPFFSIERRNEVLFVFDERLGGSSPRVVLITALHRVAFFLDIRSTYADMTEDRPHVTRMLRDFVKSSVFPEAEKDEARGGEDRAVQSLLQELSLLRLSWRSSGNDPTKRDMLWAFSDIPVVYWIEYPEKSSLLRQFTLRVLGASPSSSSVERSFSRQGRILTNVRNRLNHTKVRKMIFCSYNDILLCQHTTHIGRLSKKNYKELRFGGWNRSIRRATGSGGRTGTLIWRLLCVSK